jgi:hypothetical protein
MVVEPLVGSGASVTALGEKGLYVYRVISLLSESGTEVLACAARTGGVAAGEFTGSQATKMRTAIRLLSHGGDLYVLTSKGLYVLAKLASQFLARELYPGVVTQILTVPMEALDANLAGDHWLLVVLPDKVCRFDAAGIHDNAPEDGSEQEDFRTASVSPDWQWMTSNSR